jgi:hypothetical protein
MFNNKAARFGALAGAAALVLSTIAQVASASPPPDVFKDNRGNVYIHGGLATTLAGQASARAQTDEAYSRNLRAGYCGEIRLATSSTLPSIGDSWTINGQTKLRSSLPVISDRNLLPRCSSNAFIPALDSSITSAGGFIDNTSTSPKVYLTLPLQRCPEL